MTAFGVNSALFRTSAALAPHYTGETSQFRGLLTICERYGVSVYLLESSPDFSQPARPSWYTLTRLKA